MRVVFFGTPEFSLPTLDALHLNHEVVGVVTQPDQPSGRGNKIIFSPVKRRALELSLPVFGFERVRKQAALDCLRSLKADAFVTAAYGQILSQKLLDIPKYGTINVHGSLLPKYRGAAPAQFAIIDGERVSGVTIMATDAGIDTGDILLQSEVAIDEADTAESLLSKLAVVGAGLLIETLDLIRLGVAVRLKQEEASATYCKTLTKEAGRVDFQSPAEVVHNLIRGVYPWPGAFTDIDGETIKIHRAELIKGDRGGSTGLPGTVVVDNDKRGVAVLCGRGAIRLLELQRPGGKRMSANEYQRGRPIPIGSMIGARERGSE